MYIKLKTKSHIVFFYVCFKKCLWIDLLLNSDMFKLHCSKNPPQNELALLMVMSWTDISPSSWRRSNLMNNTESVPAKASQVEDFLGVTITFTATKPSLLEALKNLQLHDWGLVIYLHMRLFWCKVMISPWWLPLAERAISITFLHRFATWIF